MAPSSVFLSDPDVTLYHGDVLAVLPSVPKTRCKARVRSPWGERGCKAWAYGTSDYCYAHRKKESS